jgi:hypothetical protein
MAGNFFRSRNFKSHLMMEAYPVYETYLENPKIIDSAEYKSHVG